MPASPIQVRVRGPHLHLFGPVFEPRAPPDASPQRQDRGARARCPRVIMSILGHSTILLTMNTCRLRVPS
jgi:hypothetical protein